MEASATTDAIVDRANELYWGSDHSVNQIADELDLSKGALYAMVESEPAGVGCPMCGAEVGYANRTTKERGQIECATCEWDGTLDEAAEVVEEAEAEDEKENEERVLSINESSDVPSVTPPADDRFRTIAGGALIGAAVGLALVIWARRR